MPFFQNVFSQEYQGFLNTGNDRQYSLTFKVPANRNGQDYQFGWNAEPYNLTGNTTLTFNYAWDTDYKNISSLAINVSGATVSATTAAEIVTALNANTTFASMFLAKVADNGTDKHVLITSKIGRAKQIIRMHISNSSAEKIIKFNKYAGVAELPSYFSKDTINNRFVFTNGLNHLIQLDESDSVDQAIITAAGFDYTAMQDDWELLRGRAAGIYTFKKQTIDGSGRVTEIIEYPAGAVVGDLARKTEMSYTGANTQPDQITQIPYVLQNADLVTP